MVEAEVGPPDQDGLDGRQVAVEEAEDFPEVAEALVAAEAVDHGKNCPSSATFYI